MSGYPSRRLVAEASCSPAEPDPHRRTMTIDIDSSARIRELEAKVAELSALIQQPRTSSRRGMLKLAAGAAAGAVAATALGTGNNASALDTEPILIGATTSGTADSGNETVAVYNSS